MTNSQLELLCVWVPVPRLEQCHSFGPTAHLLCFFIRFFVSLFGFLCYMFILRKLQKNQRKRTWKKKPKTIRPIVKYIHFTASCLMVILRWAQTAVWYRDWNTITTNGNSRFILLTYSECLNTDHLLWIFFSVSILLLRLKMMTTVENTTWSFDKMN